MNALASEVGVSPRSVCTSGVYGDPDGSEGLLRVRALHAAKLGYASARTAWDFGASHRALWLRLEQRRNKSLEKSASEDVLREHLLRPIG